MNGDLGICGDTPGRAARLNCLRSYFRASPDATMPDLSSNFHIPGEVLYEQMVLAKDRFHAGRTSGGHCHHRHSDRPVVTCGPGAREAARRSQCSNNLKQVILALHNYHDTHQTFPSGVIWGPGKAPYTLPYHHTWLVMILPFMEQQPLYDSTNLMLPVWGQTIVSTPVASLRCPSDAGRFRPSDTSNIAVTNYAGSEGYHWHPTCNINPATAGQWYTAGSQAFGDKFTQACSLNGLFTVTQTYRIASVVDGTSNTIAVAEDESMGFAGGAIRTCGTGMRRTGTPVFDSAFVGTAVNGWGANETGANAVSPDGSAKTNGTWFRNHSFTPTYIAAYGPNTTWQAH